MKLLWGKMGGVYVTYVADVDKGQLCLTCKPMKYLAEYVIGTNWHN